jgi:Flp pilus assembly pilin Flp
MFNEWGLRALVACQSLRRKLGDDEGQTLAEYGLIMSIVAVAVIATAVIVFRGALESMFHEAADCLTGVTCPY